MAFVAQGTVQVRKVTPAKQDYAVDDSLKEALMQAAFGQVRIEVEINDNKPGITGLRVPATPALR